MKLNPLSLILSLDAGEPYTILSHYAGTDGSKLENVSQQMVQTGAATPVNIPLTVGKALMMACEQHPKEPSAKLVLERVTLMAKLQRGLKSGKLVDLSSEQVVSLKELVSTGIQPMSLAGLICCALEGETELEGITFLQVPEVLEALKPAAKGGRK